MHYNMGIALKNLGKNEEASTHLHKAVQGYQEDLAVRPDSVKTVRRIGNAFAEIGNFTQAINYLQMAVYMNPYDIKNHTTLVDVLVNQKHYDEAITALKTAIDYMKQSGDKENAEKLQESIELVEFKKFKKSKTEQ